jgi:hypothetical protein
MNKQEWIELGEKKYDRFLKKIGFTANVMTPHTATLETLGGLKEDSNSFIRCAVIELSKNFEI